MIDPILSILIGVLITITSLRLLRESLLILMEGVPGHITLQEVKNKMCACTGVNAIHDLHIWTLTSGTVAISAHVDIKELSQWQQILIDLRDMLQQQYEINHVTLQPEPTVMDCQPCQDPKK